jgi:hypothetical protein
MTLTKKMWDFLFLTIGGVALVASLACFVIAVRRIDDIWHARRARAPRLFLAGMALLTTSAIALWFSPIVRSLIA